MAGASNSDRSRANSAEDDSWPGRQSAAAAAAGVLHLQLIIITTVLFCVVVT